MPPAVPPGMVVSHRLERTQIDFSQTNLIDPPPPQRTMTLQLLMLLGGAFMIAAVQEIWQAGLTLVILLIAYVALWLGGQDIRPRGLLNQTERKPRSVRLTLTHVHFRDGEETNALPLEAILHVDRTPQHLRLLTARGYHHLYNGILPTHAEWLVKQITQHSRRRRTALQAAGQDPDRVALPPSELRSLINRNPHP